MMSACSVYDVNPCKCYLIKNYDTFEGETHAEILRNLHEAFKDVIFGGELKMLYNAAGHYKTDLLLVYKASPPMARFVDSLVDGKLKLNDKLLVCQSVQEAIDQEAMDKLVPVPVTQSIKIEQADKEEHRKLKPFPGTEKLQSGECHIKEWLIGAREVVDHCPSIPNTRKIQILRNSLVRNALTLVASIDITDPRLLVEMIAQSYGAGHSKRHLWFQFFQLKQRTGEMVSDYLVRIQQDYKEIERVEGKPLDDKNLLVYRQFQQGLEPGIHDLVTLHLGLKEYSSVDDYPGYDELMKKVLAFELDRRERKERACQNAETGAIGGANVFGDIPQPNYAISDSEPGEVDKRLDELSQMIKELTAKLSESNQTPPHVPSRRGGKKGANVGAATAIPENPVPQSKKKKKGVLGPEWGTQRNRLWPCFVCGLFGHPTWNCPTEEYNAEECQKRALELATCNRMREPPRDQPKSEDNPEPKN